MEAELVRLDESGLAEVAALYERAAAFARERARGAEYLPAPEQIARDIENGRLYALREGRRVLAALSLRGDIDGEYARLSWQYGVEPALACAIAAEPCDGRGDIIARALELACGAARRRGFDSLRADADGDDGEMLAACARVMSREVGAADFGDGASVCFERPLTPLCPMLPIAMSPAYRAGALTPWGGDGLKTIYGKDIPDPRTGEALEVSAIKGLESLSASGEKLTDIIARDPLRVMGAESAGEFPLLLKLLCAAEPLSVQVHPNDAYSREHEGKLGKTEAWVILHADKGAGILYGLNEGVTTEALRAALSSGEDISPMIARVEAAAGDVFYMPSGMVHAIGGGIVLYEIQQSSDVTYRLWDYNRTNERGEKRPLHIKQALDVIVPELRGERAKLPPEGGNQTATLLDVPAFRLDCVCVNGEYELPAHTGGFRIITALKALLLSWQNDALELEAGRSALLPAACPPVTLMGVGRALVAMESK